MIYTIEKCRELGRTHAAYDWNPSPRWHEDESRNITPWNEAECIAYLEGYFAELGVPAEKMAERVQSALPIWMPRITKG